MNNQLFNEKVLWIAHRGLSSVEKENTINAFMKASELPFYGMECDIHQTTDDKYVIHHDHNLKRLTGFDLNIKENTYEQLLETKFSIPLLEEYVEICKSKGIVAVIELKQSFNEEQILDIYNRIIKMDYLDKVIFISFHRHNLIWMRELDANIPLQFLSSKFNEDILEYCIKYSLDVDLEYHIVTKELVEQLKSHHMKINVYTVNNLELAKNLIELGVDFITTDGIKEL